MYDPIEKSGAPSAPGEAHRRIVWSGPAPWWMGRADYESVGVHLPSIASADEAFNALGRYKLAKVPMYCYPTRNEDGTPKKVKVSDVFAVVRSDTKEPLAGVSVTDSYSIIQPEAAFDTCDAIVKGTGAKYEILGELAGGRDLWATLKLDTTITVAGESILPYLLFYTSHDGCLLYTSRPPISLVSSGGMPCLP